MLAGHRAANAVSSRSNKDCGVNARRLGGSTHVLTAGTFLRDESVSAMEEYAAGALAQDALELVFDLTSVAGYETSAARHAADLWKRLHGLGCLVIVACSHTAVVHSLGCIIAAQGAWTLHATLDDALHAALSVPVG